MKKMTTATKIKAMSLIVGVLCAAPARAQGHDEFAHTIPPAPTQAPQEEQRNVGAMSWSAKRTPVVAWFESYDTTVYKLAVSDEDRLTLTRPFDKEAERVQQWIDTASRIIKNYRSLVASLRTMSVPEDAPDVKQYRDKRSQWYSDTADLLADMIRPRRPPKTQEELEAQIQKVKDKVAMLKQEKTMLKMMDGKLRNEYSVHASKETDALHQYVYHK